MPTLRTWQVHHPNDWTVRQRQEYAEDATQLLLLSMATVVQHVGPANAINMMLGVMKHICIANPSIIDGTLDQALDWCADVSKVDHPTEGRTVN